MHFDYCRSAGSVATAFTLEIGQLGLFMRLQYGASIEPVAQMAAPKAKATIE
jgi:hypothetical protein